jgi:hypothetical protein
MLHEGGAQMMRFGRRSFWIFLVLVLALVNCQPTGPGSERWVYRLLGTNGYPFGQATVVACASDGTVYAAGQVSDTIEVVAVTADGQARWTYRYRASAGIPYGLALDSEGNLYVAGETQNDGTAPNRLLLLSIDPSGAERWVYLPAGDSGSGGYGSSASSVICGQDGNVYVAGSINGRFAVVSLTASGQERWNCEPAGTGSYSSVAQSVLWGTDGNLYAGGTLVEPEPYPGSNLDLMYASVVSLTPGGVARWVYERSLADSSSSYGSSLIQGADGNLYLLCSYMHVTEPYQSMAGVASLTLDGQERWARDYEAGGSVYDGNAWALARSSDDGVFLGMYSLTDNIGSASRFSVASLDSTGQQRWLYTNNHELSGAAGIAMTTGDDGNLYCAGSFNETGDFSLASLSKTGSLRWVYQYATGLFGGQSAALGLAWGGGNVCAGGYASGYRVGQYFLVVSLSADGAD